MNDLIKLSKDLLLKQHFDCLAVAIIDFENNSYKSFEIADDLNLSSTPSLYFDLASITKVLTSAAIYQKSPELFDEELELLLNHAGGLPAWGRLSHIGWKEQLSSYKIKKSPTLYSDFSVLRLMLELEKKSKKMYKELADFYWDRELYFWKDLPIGSISPITGRRNRKFISGEVHDDNCFVISKFCSHAGMFATINGLSQSLINLNKKTSLLEKMKKDFTSKKYNRFLNGWDTVTDLDGTLAGRGCSDKTFGHLGFTGTSIWIDAEKRIGIAILTNATKSYSYERAGLNHLRRCISQKIWENEAKL